MSDSAAAVRGQAHWSQLQKNRKQEVFEGLGDGELFLRVLVAEGEGEADVAEADALGDLEGEGESEADGEAEVESAEVATEV